MAEIRTKRPGWILRLVLRVVHPSKRKVWTTSDLAEVRGLLRFVRVFLLTILLPGVVLAGIGLYSITSQELSVDLKLQTASKTLTSTLLSENQERFQNFERNVQARLASGQSPLASLAELSPHLRVSLLLGPTGDVIAPIELPGGSDEFGSDLLFSETWLTGLKAEQTRDLPTALAAYRKVERQARGDRIKGEALFAQSRVLIALGRNQEAIWELNRVIDDFGELREAHGFRLGDLARLARAEQQQQNNPGKAREDLERLVDSLLSSVWMIGSGGEAAVCGRALDALEGLSDPNWLSKSRSLLEEKTSQLYWSEQSLAALSLLTKDPGPGVPNDSFNYQSDDLVMWSTLRVDQNTFVFVFELEAIKRDIVSRAEKLSEQTKEVEISLVRSEQPVKNEYARRTLLPQLSGWSVVAQPGDTQLLKNQNRRKKNQQLILISLPVLLFVAGVVLTSRMIGQEIKVASMKADFAANVSHELRSPITQIRLKGEFLQMGLADSETEQQEHYDVIVRESERLSRLVDNVLDFAAIESGTKSYTLRPADIGETIRAAVESARYSMETRGLRMELDVPEGLPVVMHEPEAIQQVLQNLISNAAKYGEDGGWIGIRANIGHQAVDVAVSDRGIGMTEEELAHIFEKFYRSNSPKARREKGTGIGLAIVQYIMEAHHASVSVKSTPGVGTTFTLHFPIRSPVASGL